MDDAERREQIRAINRLLRGETTEWKNSKGMTYRRVLRDGREYWEQSYADGATKRAEITPGLQALMSTVADTDRTEELERIFRDSGVPLPGDPLAPPKN